MSVDALVLLTTLCDWLKKNSRYLLNQSGAKPKPEPKLGHTRFPAFPPVTFIWFVVLFMFAVVGHFLVFARAAFLVSFEIF